MSTPPVPADPQALATVASFMQRFPELTQDIDPNVIGEILVEATANIEDRTSRRLAPFTDLTYETMMFGIDPNEYGDTGANMPVSIYGSLGISFANALGAGDLCRHFWMDQFAPTYPELWTYDISAMELILTYGNSQPVDIIGGGVIGGAPEVTTGHCWLRLGTFSPPGTRVKVVYSGGYTAGIPPSLSRACLFQAVRFLMMEGEPVLRSGISADDLELQIDKLIAPWVRG